MKNKIIIICCVFGFVLQGIKAQYPLDSVLRQIEANSTTLQALRQQAEAQKLENKTGIYLANPEFDFAYMWGRPTSEGNRYNINAVQSFDFPTAYAYRSRVAGGSNLIADYGYESSRKDLLLQTGALCVELIYRNSLKEELDLRLQHAERMSRTYQELFTMGNIDILERNKSQLNLLNARKAAEANEIERTALLSELQRLNGGKEIPSAIIYPEYLLPQDFEEWYEQAQENNPNLKSIAKEIEVSKNRIKLSRALSLPKFSAGYTNETVADVTMQGFTVGVSIPLWENKNTIKQAKVQTEAWKNIETDTRLQFYNSLKTQYNKAYSLQSMLVDYRDVLQSSNSAELMVKSLELGKISLTDYIVELSIYYEAKDNILQAERDYWLAVLELRQWDSGR
ncbi:MAG: TolC family protein [Bacteroidales bacterium]|jgi:outer membrane protein TolC|nr:TolC family protein [Bacteroidales bacterium]